ncbi:MAG TPA: serine/threonine-protein kinase [Thermoanaerobaculia bacterium]|nr:serine/threonine-protein kinase [Thermoanaerobaculia bacterium]
MRNLAPGSRLGRFQIVSVIGEGAMGVVYLANDPEIERPVAVKTLRAMSEASPAARADLEARFLKEAKLAGRLQHPNVVTVYEVGREQDTSFIAMEYVEGASLNQVAAEGRLDTAARVEIIRQVAQALQHAHERGVLHRDIKPGNILVTRDRRVKVADFGIGKLLSSGTGDLTRTGQMLGSPAYMSPEQIRGEKLDGRSDLFSLAVVSYELLTGSRPFPGDSITTLVYQILHTEPRDPLELRRDLPSATRDVFTRLLAKSPDKRPADAAEFLREIRRIEAELRSTEPTQAITVVRAPSPPAVPVPKPAPPPAPAVAAPPPRPSGPPAAPAMPLERRPEKPAHARSTGPLYLFGMAALLVAIALLVWIWRASEKREERLAAAVTAAPSPVSAPAAASPTAAAIPTPEPMPTAESLPTPGPAAAADAIVGATRLERAAPTRARAVPSPGVAATPSPAATASAPPPVVVASGTEAGASTSSRGSVPPPDNVYRTRRFAKFASSPDQARIYLDGRYVGIADDWDDRGGGKTLPFVGDGVHRVRMELPGYRTLNLDVIVTSSARDDTVDIDDELKRESRVDYPKLKGPFDRTEGPVEFVVVPPDAVVSEGGKPLGPASSFGSASPLKLPGPTVHDLLISAPGYEPRPLRILVSSNADRPKATVKLALKALKP